MFSALEAHRTNGSPPAARALVVALRWTSWGAGLDLLTGSLRYFLGN